MSAPPARKPKTPKPVGSITPARSWAIYGRAGTGKTTFSSTFPKPILLLDVKDEGTDSIRDVKGVDVIEVESSEDLEDAYWLLHKNAAGYKTVVIDTMTQLQQLVVEEIARKKNRSERDPGDWGSLTKGDWGDVSSYMKTWIINFRDLPMETVFIAQDRAFNIEEEEGELAPEIGPRLSPATSAHLCASVSCVGNTFIRSRVIRMKSKLKKPLEKTVIEYCLRLGPNSVYITKLRKPLGTRIPNELVNPAYQDVLDLIHGEE